MRLPIPINGPESNKQERKEGKEGKEKGEIKTEPVVINSEELSHALRLQVSSSQIQLDIHNLIKKG